jgi:SAUR family protein
MGFGLPSIIRKTASSKGVDVPKGYFSVSIGEEMKRFVIPISYLKKSSFQELLNQVEDQLGYDHPTGGLTIPCREETFLDITSRLSLE